MTSLWSSLVTFSRTPGYGWILPELLIAAGILLFILSLVYAAKAFVWVFDALGDRHAAHDERRRQASQMEKSPEPNPCPPGLLDQIHQASLSGPAAKRWKTPVVVDINQRRQQLSAVAIGRERIH